MSAHGGAGGSLVGLVVKGKQSPDGALLVVLRAPRQKQAGRQPASRAQEEAAS